MRTETVKPGQMAEVKKQYELSLPERVKLSPCAGLFQSEVGTLNQWIHLWPYKDLLERDQIRAEAVKLGVWPPKSGHCLDAMESKILIPAPFSPPLEPRQLGGIYEIRTYTMKPGAIPKVIDLWKDAMPARIKLSPLVGAWSTELGPLNQWVHMWAYKDMGERQRVRNEAVASGVWPPKIGEFLVKQECCFVVPMPFSNLR
jgi:hypothetical protein